MDSVIMKKSLFIIAAFFVQSVCWADFKVEASNINGPQTKNSISSQKNPESRTTVPATFEITKSDGHLRNVLTNWGGMVEPKWKVVWQAPRDLLIDGDDRFSGDFKTAVRDLLKSTKQTDMELQPCFHTNNVVRIVKKTVRCDANAN